MTDSFVVDTPGIRAVSVQRDLDYHGGDPSLRMDVYRPVGVGPWPVVLFVHGEAPAGDSEGGGGGSGGGGGGGPAGLKESAQYVGWGRLVASMGMVGVVFAPRSWDRLRHVARKLADVEAALRFVRARGHLWGADTSRLAVWSAAAGVPVGVALAAREAEAGVRCAVAYYGPMDLRPYGDDPRLADVSPMALVEAGSPLVPLLVVRCGEDDDELNQSIDDFTNAGVGPGPARRAAGVRGRAPRVRRGGRRRGVPDGGGPDGGVPAGAPWPTLSPRRRWSGDGDT